MEKGFGEWMEERTKSEAVSDWASVERNPLLKSVAESLSRQKEKLTQRYGKKTADRIIAWTVAGGFVPLPGFQVALLLGMLGVSEIARAMRRGEERLEKYAQSECEKVADEVEKELEDAQV